MVNKETFQNLINKLEDNFNWNYIDISENVVRFDYGKYFLWVYRGGYYDGDVPNLKIENILNKAGWVDRKEKMADRFM
jgi:mannosyltransferase OCH1-like enzyme